MKTFLTGQLHELDAVFLLDIAVWYIQHGIRTAAVVEFDREDIAQQNFVGSFGFAAVDFHRAPVAKFFGETAAFNDARFLKELIEPHQKLRSSR